MWFHHVSSSMVLPLPTLEEECLLQLGWPKKIVGGGAEARTTASFKRGGCVVGGVVKASLRVRGGKGVCTLGRVVM